MTAAHTRTTTVDRRRFGALTLAASNPTGGYALRVYIGADEFPDLAFTDTSRDAFRGRYAYIATRARAGVLAETIAAEIHILTTAAQVIAAVEVTCPVCDMTPCGCPTFQGMTQ